MQSLEALPVDVKWWNPQACLQLSFEPGTRGNVCRASKGSHSATCFPDVMKAGLQSKNLTTANKHRRLKFNLPHTPLKNSLALSIFQKPWFKKPPKPKVACFHPETNGYIEPHPAITTQNAVRGSGDWCMMSWLGPHPQPYLCACPLEGGKVLSCYPPPVHWYTLEMVVPKLLEYLSLGLQNGDMSLAAQKTFTLIMGRDPPMSRVRGSQSWWLFCLQGLPDQEPCFLYHGYWTTPQYAWCLLPKSWHPVWPNWWHQPCADPVTTNTLKL